MASMVGALPGSQALEFAVFREGSRRLPWVTTEGCLAIYLTLNNYIHIIYHAWIIPQARNGARIPSSLSPRLPASR